MFKVIIHADRLFLDGDINQQMEVAPLQICSSACVHYSVFYSCLNECVDMLSRSLPIDEHSSTQSPHVLHSPIFDSRPSSRAETSDVVSRFVLHSSETLSPDILYASPVDYSEPEAGTADEIHVLATVEFEEHGFVSSAHTDRFPFFIMSTSSANYFIVFRF